MAEQTLTIAEAGRRYFGLKRAASYNAAKAGFIPTIKRGRNRMVVPVRAMEELLNNPRREPVPNIGGVKEEWPGYG